MYKKFFAISLTCIVFLQLFISFSKAEQTSLIINEVMPNPTGSDSDFEWIELKNNSENVLALNLWSLDGKTLPQGSINPDEIVIIAKKKTGFISRYGEGVQILEMTTLNLLNAGATLVLSDSAGNTSKFIYTESAEEISFELKQGTCGLVAPHSSSHSAKKVNESCPNTSPTITTTPSVTSLPSQYQRVSIYSAMPNPNNSAEWIKLKNSESFSINLQDWTLQDASGNRMTLSQTIDAKGLLQVFTEKVTLNNDADTIYLYDSQHRLIDIFEYASSAKDIEISNQSLVPTVTPAATNITNNSTELPLPEFYTFEEISAALEDLN